VEWQDEGIVLSARRHGETALIVMVMTRLHGRHAGLVYGQRQRARLQPGTRAAVRWRARLSDHLGLFAVEPARDAAGGLMDKPVRLAALLSACEILAIVLPEREPAEALYEGSCALLDALAGPFWAASYVRWELGALDALGFALDLSRCALTGATDDLAFVSPRTGRAVARGAAEPYRDRLLPLPAFLMGGGVDAAAILDGLALTGHFLERHLLSQTVDTALPARARFVGAYRRAAGLAPAQEDAM
jgi:DNA repair protein RecO (recombination protein O)